MQSKKPFPAAKSIFVVFVTLLLPSAIATAQTQQAAKFKVLHTFHGPNGAGPTGQLTRDDMGNLYGTTGAGGTGECSDSFDDRCGTAFELNRAGKQVWLHSFNGKNGQEPAAGLLRDNAGNLYGTTVLGGDTTCYSLGCGVLFKLDSKGEEKLLYRFTGTPDGWFPESLLIADGPGSFFGTTPNGGNSGLGTVFKWDQSTAKERVVYSFGGGTDGSAPFAGLIRDSLGNLYGTTLNGGQMSCDLGCGTVFKLDTDGTEIVLYRFQGGTDGEFPFGRLVLDAAGNLYGTTEQGGSSDVCDDGCGTVFELSPNENGSWAEKVLYSFCSLENCADGRLPDAGMVQDKTGNLYGTTIFGGSSSDAGIVFRLDKSGRQTVLHTFTGGSDGAEPLALIQDSAGNLYGVATIGGDTACFAPDGCGVVFKLTP